MSYVELPADAVLDHEQPAQDTRPVAIKQANGRWLLDPGATVTPNAPADGTGAANGNGSGLVELPADAQLDQPKVDAPTTLLGNIGLGARDVLGSIGQGLNFIQTPTAAVWSALGGQPEDYEKAADQFADSLGLPRVPTDGHIGSAFRRGLGLGVLTAGTAAPLAEAGGVTGAIAKTLAQAPIADAVSTGTSEAAGELAKEHGAGPVGQIAASLAGGGLGAAVTQGGAAAATRAFASTEPSELLAAFQRQQVTPMAAQVGGTGARAMQAGAKATLGGIPLAAAAERSIATAKAARDRIAASMGAVRDDTGAGQALQQGTRSFIDSTAARGEKLYQAIPIAGDKPAILSNTKQALADLNSGLQSNPELSALIQDPRLKAYESAFNGSVQNVPTGILDSNGNAITRPVQKGGQLSWQDLKAFRSYVGELAGRQTLQDSTSKDALQRLYSGLSEDMRATAQADGPKSLQAFERANTFWRARQDRIDNTLKLILGNDFQKSPEGAFSQIDRWAREGGDAARLARTIRSLPADEADTVRATIFSRMGRAAPGQQNAAVDAFSPASFGTQWAKLDPRAKAVLFPGQQYRQDLDDIAKIAEAMKGSEKFANTSGTALAERLGKNLFGATVVSYLLHPSAAISGEGVGYAGGMLLSSPRFARWLASTPKKPVGPATLAHINRLTAIATAEPQIANEVLRLQQQLASAFTDAPMKAAARPDNENRQ